MPSWPSPPIEFYGEPFIFGSYMPCHDHQPACIYCGQPFHALTKNIGGIRFVACEGVIPGHMHQEEFQPSYPVDLT